jgi:hypothetical protein
MKTSHISYLILISLILSCGKKDENQTRPSNTQHLYDHMEFKMPTPDLKLEQSRFHFRNEKMERITYKSPTSYSGLRQKLLKKIAQQFRDKQIHISFSTDPTITLINEHELYRFNERYLKQDLKSFILNYSIASSTPIANLKNVSASLGSSDNKLLSLSLSKNLQDSEESISIASHKMKRKVISGGIPSSGVRYHLKSKIPLELTIDDYEIHYKERVASSSYQKLKQEILQSHYELVISSLDKTSIHYIKKDIPFDKALKKITDGQFLADEDGIIQSLYGQQNHYHLNSTNEIELKQTFIKLINFESQSIYEKPIAGGQYAIALFKLEELQLYGKLIREYQHEIKLNSSANAKSLRIPKSFFTSSLISMEVHQIEMKQNIHKRPARAVRNIMKECQLKIATLKKSPPFKLNYEEGHSFITSKNKNIQMTILGEQKLITNKEPFLDLYFSVHPSNPINLGTIWHNCRLHGKNEVIMQDTLDLYFISKRQIPRFEYVIKLSIKEYGNIF